jgi:hypothetical protein
MLCILARGTYHMHRQGGTEAKQEVRMQQAELQSNQHYGINVPCAQ